MQVKQPSQHELMMSFFSFMPTFSSSLPLIQQPQRTTIKNVHCAGLSYKTMYRLIQKSAVLAIHIRDGTYTVSSSQHLVQDKTCVVFLLPTHMPLMTPSGLRMGMILKIKASLRLWATGSLLHRNSRVPFITQLALDSPGCTRPVSTIQARLPGERKIEFH